MVGEMKSPRVVAMSARKQEVRRHFNTNAAARGSWLKRSAFFHQEDLLYLKYLIPKGARVLELGCGNGHLLAALKPSFGVGVDLSKEMVAQARKIHSDLVFYVGDIEDGSFIKSLPGPFDFIVIIDTLGLLDDCQDTLDNLHKLCTRQTRIVIGYYSHLWFPALRVAEAIGLKMPQPPDNILAPADIRSLALLSDFDPIKTEVRLLVPVSLFGLGQLVNRFVAPLPIIRQLCIRHYTVCRSLRHIEGQSSSVTIVIPARNERGNIEPTIKRIPFFGSDLEIIFVEGHSYDGTWEEIERSHCGQSAFTHQSLASAEQRQG